MDPEWSVLSNYASVSTLTDRRDLGDRSVCWVSMEDMERIDPPRELSTSPDSLTHLLDVGFGRRMKVLFTHEIGERLPHLGV